MSDRATVLVLVRDDVRYTVRANACGHWVEGSKQVRVAVVHCEDLSSTDNGSAWSVSVRLENGEPAEAAPSTVRALPPEVERRVIDLLRGARRTQGRPRSAAYTERE